MPRIRPRAQTAAVALACDVLALGLVRPGGLLQVERELDEVKVRTALEDLGKAKGQAVHALEGLVVERLCENGPERVNSRMAPHVGLYVLHERTSTSRETAFKELGMRAEGVPLILPLPLPNGRMSSKFALLMRRPGLEGL